MEARASAKYIRVSARKMRRSVDLIRGRHVDDARRILRLTPLGPNRTLVKVLDSAVANAAQKDLIPENLVVARAWVDEGPTLRRFRPRAYGRATRIRKRTTHVTVVVEQLGELGGATGPAGMPEDTRPRRVRRAARAREGAGAGTEATEATETEVAGGTQG